MNVIEASCEALSHVDPYQLLSTVRSLQRVQRDRKARVFCVGNGGGFAHATHFASDLTKIVQIPAFSADNIPQLTARINDDGWDSCLANWLAAYHFSHHDALFVFSVGGGSDTTSANLTHAINYAHGSWTEAGDSAPLLGIVGAAGGHIARYGTPIIVPSFDTPVIEGCQSVIAHQIVEDLCE